VYGLIVYRLTGLTDSGMPVSLMMAAMLYTGSKALQHLPVPIFTIFKNLSIILVAYTETTVFGGKVTRLMLVSFFLMVKLYQHSYISGAVECVGGIVGRTAFGIRPSRILLDGHQLLRFRRFCGHDALHDARNVE
jgi:hypothetical protein